MEFLIGAFLGGVITHFIWQTIHVTRTVKLEQQYRILRLTYGVEQWSDGYQVALLTKENHRP